MKTAPRRHLVAPSALTATLLAAFLVLLSPLSATAHDSLLSSSPQAGSVVETLPAELTLTFSSQLIEGEGSTQVVVTDPSGTSVTDGVATVEGAIVTQPLVAEAAAGEYHVTWKVVSSDGHPTSNEFSFTVSTSTITAATATPSAAPTSAAPTSAAPSAEATETPSANTAQQPAETDSTTPDAWPWLLTIAGILIVAAVVTWLVVRARRSRPQADSDGPTAR